MMVAAPVAMIDSTLIAASESLIWERAFRHLSRRQPGRWHLLNVPTEDSHPDAVPIFHAKHAGKFYVLVKLERAIPGHPDHCSWFDEPEDSGIDPLPTLVICYNPACDESRKGALQILQSRIFGRSLPARQAVGC